jgi:signal transduction histidine kinase
MWTNSWLSTQMSRRPLVRYIVSVAAVVLALLLRRALSPFLDESLPYITVFPAIAVSAWYCGVLPSMLAIALAIFGTHSHLIVPGHSSNATDLAGIVAFVLAATLFVVVGEAGRRTVLAARIAQAELEERIRERTAELDSVNRNLRELTGRLLQLQDEERRRIARELHDSVGQMLAALSMNLTAVRADIDRLTTTAGTLTDSEGLVKELSKEVRTISHLLHPPLLEEAGLESAVRWYIDGFAQRSNIRVELDLPQRLGRFSRELETAIFRIIQECLTNIHRHAESPTASIRIIRSDKEIRVEVKDQGRGIPPEKQAALAVDGKPGVGLRGMRERVRQLGGTLEIDSRGSGKGTVVIARVPVGETSSTAAA